MYEDQAFLAKIYLQENVYVSSACNNLYRQRPESIVQTVHTAGHYHKVRKYYLEWLNNYLNQKQINNKLLKKSLKKALLPYNHPFIYFVKNKAPKSLIIFFKKIIRYILRYK